MVLLSFRELAKARGPDACEFTKHLRREVRTRLCHPSDQIQLKQLLAVQRQVAKRILASVLELLDPPQFNVVHRYPHQSCRWTLRRRRDACR